MRFPILFFIIPLVHGVHFSQDELKRVQKLTRVFFENIKNQTGFFPPRNGNNTDSLQQKDIKQQPCFASSTIIGGEFLL